MIHVSETDLINPFPDREIESKLVCYDLTERRIELSDRIFDVIRIADPRYALWSGFEGGDSTLTHVRSVIHQCLRQDGSKFAKIVERYRDPDTVTFKAKRKKRDHSLPPREKVLVKAEKTSGPHPSLELAQTAVQTWAKKANAELDGYLYSGLLREKIGVVDQLQRIFFQIAVDDCFGLTERGDPLLLLRQVEIEYKGQQTDVDLPQEELWQSIVDSIISIRTLVMANVNILHPTHRSKFAVIQDHRHRSPPEDLDRLREFVTEQTAQQQLPLS